MGTAQLAHEICQRRQRGGAATGHRQAPEVAAQLDFTLDHRQGGQGAPAQADRARRRRSGVLHARHSEHTG